MERWVGTEAPQPPTSTAYVVITKMAAASALVEELSLVDCHAHISAKEFDEVKFVEFFKIEFAVEITFFFCFIAGC